MIPSRPSGTHCSCWLEHLAHEGRRHDLRGMLGGRRSPRRGGAAARWRWCRGGAARGSRWVCASKAAVLVVAVRATRWGGARWRLAAVAPGGGARRGSGASAEALHCGQVASARRRASARTIAHLSAMASAWREHALSAHVQRSLIARNDASSYAGVSSMVALQSTPRKKRGRHRSGAPL